MSQSANFSCHPWPEPRDILVHWLLPCLVCLCLLLNGSPARAGDGRAGDGRAGDGRAGDGRAGDGRAGDGRAGDGKTGENSGLAGRVGSAVPSVDPLDSVRLLVEQKFWEEARRVLVTLETSAETNPLERSLLLAEVCYQSLDLPCTVEALARARSRASAESLEKVAGLETLLHDRVGKVHLRLEPVGPVALIRQDPLLDTHLQTLVEKTRAELRSLSARNTLTRARTADHTGKESGETKNVPPRRVTRWLDPASGAELTGPAPGHALLELWLPLGTYRLDGQELQVKQDQRAVVLLRRGPHAPAEQGSQVSVQGVWYSGASQAALSASPGVELLLKATRNRRGPVLGLGLAIHEDTENVTEAGQSSSTVRPTLRLGVHGTLAPLTWVRIEPEISGVWQLYPARRERCTQLEYGPSSGEFQGTCTAEQGSASLLVGMTVALHLGAWQLTLGAAGGPMLIAPLEPGILGSAPVYIFEDLPTTSGTFQLSFGLGHWSTRRPLVENARLRRQRATQVHSGPYDPSRR